MAFYGSTPNYGLFFEQLGAPALVQRYGDVASRVVVYFANPALADEATIERFGAVATQV